MPPDTYFDYYAWYVGSSGFVGLTFGNDNRVYDLSYGRKSPDTRFDGYAYLVYPSGFVYSYNDIHGV